VEELLHGRSIANAMDENGVEAMAYDAQGRLIAVVKAVDGRWKPEKVFMSADLR
jgi:YD repeat-containing protein